MSSYRLSSSMRSANKLRSHEPLTNDQIARVAPSIFAMEAHKSRSDRYAYIPTITVLDELRAEGFQPFMVCQTKTRTDDKREHTKHMLRLRHPSTIEDKEANEIILLNSHDGSSSYQMFGGVFRFACENGLVCGDAYGDQRVRHSGKHDVITEVIEGAYEVLNQFKAVDEARESMKQIILRPQEQIALATGALAYRYDEEKAVVPITPAQLLTPKRREDRADDLWTTFNRVQENIIRGGLIGRNAKNRPVRTRAVNGMDQDVKLNRALWAMAEALRG